MRGTRSQTERPYEPLLQLRSGQNETTLLGGLDADQARKNAFREAWGIRGKASNERLAGQYNYREGMNRAKAFRNQAYGTAITGFADAYPKIKTD